MAITLNSKGFFTSPAVASQVRIVSAASDGTAANNDPGGGLSFSAFFGQVYTPAVSTTGRYIAFKSQATNLVAGDANGFRDVFWKDMTTGAVQLVDVGAGGVQSNADDQNDALARLTISNDGQRVAFVGSATNLVAGDSNAVSDVFVRNIATGVTTRVSTATGGGQANGASAFSAISGNGRYVAFSSSANNLVAGDVNGHEDVFVKDLQTDTTVSITNPFNQFVARVMNMSNDGRYVMFLTDADNILPDHQGGVFIYDRVAAVFSRVDAASNGTRVTGDSIQTESYILSGDGRHVAFVSGQTGWGPADANTVADVYEKNLDTGVVTLVSANAAGQQITTGSFVNSISDDGRYVTFSAGGNAFSGSRPFGNDVNGTQTFVKDMLTGALVNITRNNGGTDVPGGAAVNGQISGDGSTVTYSVGYISPVLPAVPVGSTLELFQTNVAGTGAIGDPGDNRTISVKVNTSGANYVYMQPGDTSWGFAAGVPDGGGNTSLTMHLARDYFGDIYVFGTDGVSTVNLLQMQAIVAAAAGTLAIAGTTRDNIILAGADDNVITDPGGNNYINAGAGNDSVTGNVGSDTLFGGAGNDSLDGGDALALTAVQKSVYRLYGATLNRDPDAAGLLGWVDQLNAGKTLASITTGFINSIEFQKIYGSLNNTQFVTLLYNNVLRRAPDAPGLAGWVNLMNGGSSRESVVNGFSESAEYQANTELATRGYATSGLYSAVYGQVFRLYGATLARQPDVNGFESWVDVLGGGQTLAGITSGFVNSVEFRAAYGSLNNTQFVTLLYNNVLSRAPDAGGLAGWVNLLNGGTSRESVVLGFSESVEYQGNTAAALRAFMQSGPTNWGDVLNGGAGDDVLVGGRGVNTYQFDAGAVGNDQVYGLQSWDVLNFTGFGYSNAAAATAKMTQTGADVVFADQGETITFRNATLAVATSAGFTFV